jgi:hypothetical protein
MGKISVMKYIYSLFVGLSLAFWAINIANAEVKGGATLGCLPKPGFSYHICTQPDRLLELCGHLPGKDSGPVNFLVGGLWKGGVCLNTVVFEVPNAVLCGFPEESGVKSLEGMNGWAVRYPCNIPLDEAQAYVLKDGVMYPIGSALNFKENIELLEGIDCDGYATLDVKPKPNCNDPFPGLSTPERPSTPPSIDNPRPSRPSTSRRPFSRSDSMLRGGAVSAGNSVKRNCGKILLSCALDCDGMIVEGGKGALKGALKSGPLVLVDICAQKGIEKACEGLGATETQTEGSKALGGIGTGALCGAAIGGPPGAGIGAGISAGVETVCACGKIVYYLGDSCYRYGIGDTFEAWCGTGLDPIRYWCGD